MGFFAVIRMVVIVRAVISAVIMTVIIFTAFMGMGMTVFMLMRVRVTVDMLMTVFCAVMLVGVLMHMTVFMLMRMFVFVIAFHKYHLLSLFFRTDSVFLRFKKYFMVHQVHSDDLSPHNLLIPENPHQFPSVFLFRLHNIHRFHNQLYPVFFHHICIGLTHFS
jgi:hypothetical protein